MSTWLAGLGALSKSAAEGVIQGRELHAREQERRLRMQIYLQQVQQANEKLRLSLEQADPQYPRRYLGAVFGRPPTDEELERFLGIAPPTQAPYVDIKTDQEGNPWGLNKATGKYERIAGGFQAPRKLTRGPLVPDPTSVTGVSQVMLDSSGKASEIVRNVLVPGLVPKKVQGYITTTDQYGNIILMPETRTTVPQIPGAAGLTTGAPGATTPASRPARPPTATPAAPDQTTLGPPGYLPPGTRTSGGGTVIGRRALPPAVQERLESSMATVGKTLDLLRSLRDNLDVVKDTGAALKLSFVAGHGVLAGLAGRMFGLTPQEQQFVSDYASLQEAINQLRIATSATGFRGPYAWEALLEQRGNPLLNPGVTRRILDNSIAILTGQFNAAARATGEAPYGGTGSPSNDDRNPPQGVSVPTGWHWMQQNGVWGITDGKSFRPYQGQ